MSHPYTTEDNKPFLTLLYQLIARIEHLQKSVDGLRQPVVVNSDYLNLEQAASFICRSKDTLYGLVSRSEIPHSKKGKRLVFRRTDLEEWIEAGRRKTTKEQLADNESKMILLNKKK